MKGSMEVGSGWLHGIFYFGTERGWGGVGVKEITLYEEERNTPDVCPGDVMKDKGERCKGKTRHNAKVQLSARAISFVTCTSNNPKN